MSERSQRVAEKCLIVGNTLLDLSDPDGLRIVDVAAQVGTSVGNIYYHFESKDNFTDEIVAYRARQCLDSLDRAIAGLKPASRPSEIIQTLTNEGLMNCFRDLVLAKTRLRNSYHYGDVTQGMARLRDRLEEYYRPQFAEPADGALFLELFFSLVANSTDGERDRAFAIKVLSRYLDLTAA
jgi:AcrR family transcriptional regulator